MAVLDVNWNWLKNWLLTTFPGSQKIFLATMIGFARDFALLETEDGNSDDQVLLKS
jgi:hypothetical protein